MLVYTYFTQECWKYKGFVQADNFCGSRVIDEHLQPTNCLHNMEQEQTTFFGESSIFFSVKEKEKCKYQTV